MSSYHEYTLRRRLLPIAHFRDEWPANIIPRIIGKDVKPWSKLATPHKLISDIRDEDTGKLIGIIARPENYSDIYGKDFYYGILIQRGEDGSLSIPAGWTTDFEQEINFNRKEGGEIDDGPRRLVCLSFNIYHPDIEKRVESHLQQQRIAIQQTAWFLLWNLGKRLLNPEKKEELAQLGNLYNLSFNIDGKDVFLDQNVLPGVIRAWGGSFYELKTADGEIIGRIRRKAGPFGISALRIADEYAIEINRKYEGNKPLLYLLIALADFTHMERHIRDNCYYKGKDPSKLPNISDLFRYD